MYDTVTTPIPLYYLMHLKNKNKQKWWKKKTDRVNMHFKRRMDPWKAINLKEKNN